MVLLGKIIRLKRWCGHAYVETIEKLVRLTNPKVIIPMHTECGEIFGKMPAFAAYQDRVRVLQDGEAFYF